MYRTTTALFAAALLVGAHGADAQEKDAGWWAPAALSVVEQLSQAAQGDTPWWRGGNGSEAEPRKEKDGRRGADAPWWRGGGAPEGRDGAKSDRRDDEDDDDRWDDDDRRKDDRYRGRGEDARRGNGPPFCRNGEGHPVFGMQWCRDKGWAQSGDIFRSDRRDGGWLPARWEDVVFGGPKPGGKGRIAQPGVADILGDVVFGRLAEHGRRAGLGGAVDARWAPARAGDVLQLRMGGAPLAELTDADRDGRADLVLLRR